MAKKKNVLREVVETVESWVGLGPKAAKNTKSSKTAKVEGKSSKKPGKSTAAKSNRSMAAPAPSQQTLKVTAKNRVKGPVKTKSPPPKAMKKGNKVVKGR